MGTTVNTAYLIAGEEAEEDIAGQVVKAKRTYRVLTSFASTAATALAASGLPAKNTQHPVYSGLRVTSRVPKMQDDGIIWLIDITYEPKNSSATTYDLIRLEYGTHGLQEDVLYNKGTGKPLLDANNKPFESTVQETVEYPYIKIIKKQSSVRRDDVLTISGSINDNDTTVAGVLIKKHCGKIKIVATETESLTFPWEITYEVWVRENVIKNYIDFEGALKADEADVGWDIGIINRGYYYYESGVGHTCRTMEDILDENGDVTERRPSASPLPLDENGALLADGADPILILVQTVKEKNWSGLGLNQL